MERARAGAGGADAEGARGTAGVEVGWAGAELMTLWIFYNLPVVRISLPPVRQCLASHRVILQIPISGSVGERAMVAHPLRSTSGSSSLTSPANPVCGAVIGTSPPSPGVNCTPCNGGKYIPGAGFCRTGATWGKFGEG